MHEVNSKSADTQLQLQKSCPVYTLNSKRAWKAYNENKSFQLCR